MIKIFKKPIIRWTVGNVSSYGIDCLKQSISSWKSLYGDSFDYYLCYNNIDVNKLNFDVSLINQNEHLNSLSIGPNLTAWKLYPPRISMESHEIFIDNDLIVYEKIPLIDSFLKSKNIFFCTEGLRKNFGLYEKENRENLKINSGFFGIPPYFDFRVFIDNEIKHEWTGWFDEQGIVSSILSNNDYNLISLDEVAVCLNEFKFGKYGVHFVGLNGGNNIPWEDWLKVRFSKLKKDLI